MNKKNNLYISIIQFGEDELEKGVEFEELRQHIEDLGYTVSKDRLTRLYFDIFDVVSPQSAVGQGSLEMIKPGVKSALSTESYFRLLEYTELKEARESSTKAYRLAFAAMVISGVLAAVSIYFQIPFYGG